MKRSNGTELFLISIEKILKKYGKWFLKMCGNPAYLTYDVTHKRNKTQYLIFFFIVDLKTCQVFWGFEHFSSAIGWGAMRLVSQPKYPWFFPDFQVQYIRRPAANVLIKMKCIGSASPLQSVNKIVVILLLCWCISVGKTQTSEKSEPWQIVSVTYVIVIKLCFKSCGLSLKCIGTCTGID